MQLKHGYITYFHYTNYHKDPYPMALVLFVDKEIIHCLNLHYLSDKLTDELVEVIFAIVSKNLDARDAYNFYHNHLKKKLPHLIQNSYRIYKTKFIKDATIVSYGFNASRSFIEALKSLSKKPSNETVHKIIKTEVHAATAIKKPPEEFIRLVPSHQIVDEVEDYFSKIKSILKPKIDTTKFTGM